MLFPALARARFMRVETERVPIDRVLTNLLQRLSTNQNDVKLLYQLARVHSMAFATNSGVVEMNQRDDSPWFGYPGTDRGVPSEVVRGSAEEQGIARRHLTNAIHYYERAVALLNQGSPGNAWLALPVRLGSAWTLDQAGRRQEAIAAYRDALQHAWRKEVDPDMPLKTGRDWTWDQARSGRDRPAAGRRGYVGPGASYSDEIIGYLVRMLDPQKDAKEIAQLEADRKLVRSMPRAITPIVIPLGAETSLTQLVDPHAAVPFDLDGSGELRRWGWVRADAAWLVFDGAGAGHITSGLQLFGNVTFWIMWRDGYEALSSLDDNADGVISGHELRGLALWRDANSNGVSESGEVKPVVECGVVALDCRSEAHATGISFNPRGVTLRDGRVRPTYDWIAPGQ